MFNARLFWRTLAILFAIEACFLLCACGDWESQAIQIIQLINPAVIAVLNILTALGVSVSPAFLTAFQSWSAQAQKAVADVGNLITQYKAAEASAQPGILGQIQTALTTVAANLQSILPDLHIDDPQKQTWVAAALNAVLGFFGAIVGLLPKAAAAKTKDEMVLIHSKATAEVDAFKEDFNNAVSNFGPEYELQ